MADLRGIVGVAPYHLGCPRDEEVSHMRIEVSGAAATINRLAMAARQQHRSPGSRMRGRVLGAAALLLALAGCGAQVSNLASTPVAGLTPSEVLVDVRYAPAAGADAGNAKVAGEVAAKLQTDLVRRLTESRVTAEPFVAGTSHPGAAVLHVRITEADPGSAIERFVIGFGAGRAELQVTADLAATDTADAQPATAFATSADSGRRPGLILPGGIALATRDAVHLAIGGGIKVATSLNGGLDRTVGDTSKAIVRQLGKYYASNGWYWPTSA